MSAVESWFAVFVFTIFATVFVLAIAPTSERLARRKRDRKLARAINRGRR